MQFSGRHNISPCFLRLLGYCLGLESRKQKPHVCVPPEYIYVWQPLPQKQKKRHSQERREAKTFLPLRRFLALSAYLLPCSHLVSFWTDCKGGLHVFEAKKGVRKMLNCNRVVQIFSLLYYLCKQNEMKVVHLGQSGCFLWKTSYHQMNNMCHRLHLSAVIHWQHCQIKKIHFGVAQHRAKKCNQGCTSSVSVQINYFSPQIASNETLFVLSLKFVCHQKRHKKAAQNSGRTTASDDIFQHKQTPFFP